MKRNILTISFLFFLLTAGFTASFGQTATVGQNLLQNPGFEIYSNGTDIPAWNKVGTAYHLAYPAPKPDDHYLVGIDNRMAQDNAMAYLYQRVVLNQTTAKNVTIGMGVGAYQVKQFAGFMVYVLYCDNTYCWASSEQVCGTVDLKCIKISTAQIPGGAGKTIREVWVFPVMVGPGFGWFDDTFVIEG